MTKTLLITGCSRGIGLGLAQSYAEDGWEVLACCRDPKSAGALLDLAERQTSMETLALDVTDADAIADLAASLSRRPIDLLINNAGIYGPRGAFGSVDYQAWAQVFATNTMAPLRLAEALLPNLEAGTGKCIANLSSKVGSIAENTSGNSYIYRSSKTALNMVCKSMAIDLANKGITVLALHPGWVKTDMGGPNALISVAESVEGLRRVIDGAGPEQSGHFYEFSGKELPW